MNLNKSSHAQSLGDFAHISKILIRQNGCYQEDSIGTADACLVDLPCIDDELFAQKRALVIQTFRVKRSTIIQVRDTPKSALDICNEINNLNIRNIPSK